jgi:hypothetical protein
MNTGNAHTERRPVDDERLDSVIDTVAREMTEFEPSGALKARVFERIEQGRHRTSPVVLRWAWAGTTAAVVLVAATVIWMARPAPAPNGADSLVAEQRATAPRVQPAAPSQTAAEARVQTAAQPGPAPHGSRRAAIRSSQPHAENAAEDASVVPALSEIEPLRFSTVEPDPLHVAAVEVAPLALMPTIDIPSLGMGSNDIQSADPKKEK